MKYSSKPLIAIPMNLSKAILIIKREYRTRVRKKSFIIMTLLGPLLMGGVFLVPILLSRVSDEKRIVAVLDESHIFTGKFESDTTVTFVPRQGSLENLIKESITEKKISDILYIRAFENLDTLAKHIVLYSNSQPPLTIIERINRDIEHEIASARYAKANIDESVIESIRKIEVNVGTRDMKDKATSSEITTVIGLASGILIYMFIFIYGALVMRGVMEEKTNRIVEVIISSVKPFELMLGKIIGVALVGLTQFLLWILLTSAIYTLIGTPLLKEQMIKAQVEQSSGTETLQKNWSVELKEALATINFTELIIMFLFYFLAGYLLYSALFAAIGAAVDSETDTQQFMLPITIPLIFSVVMVQFVILNPGGPVAFWLSMFPFTSPIIMMVRLPFGGVAPWELALSMSLLVLGFIFTTWLAGKIYRTGILMYGKKVNYRELARWLFYRG